MASILTYHKIGRQRELGITTVGRPRLASHLDFVARTGRRLITACEAALPEDARDAVAITFDDGYQSVYTEAFPELEARRIPATVFPVVGAIGGDNTWDVRLSLRPARHLSWAQVEELAGFGIEIGSHTLSHRDLTALPDGALMEELATSKRILEDRTGRPVRAIAYPFGKYDRRVVDAALEAGYTCGFTSSPTGAGRDGLRGPAEAEPPMAVGRMSVYCLDDRLSLARKLASGHGYRLEALKSRAIARLSRGTIIVKRSGWGLP